MNDFIDMMLLLLTFIVLAECQEPGEVGNGLCLLQGSVGHRRSSRAPQILGRPLGTGSSQSWASGPWDQYLYFVGASHKAGTVILRNIMQRAFDVLGANYSCYERWPVCGAITMVGGMNHCKEPPHVEDCPIRWNCNMVASDMQAGRPGTASKEMRAVIIIRDPLEMVASAYCFHHRGKEPGSKFAPANITSLSPAEGMPLVADLMLSNTKDMVAAYQASGKNTHAVKYEDITRSSADFDRVVAGMFSFLFGGLINDSSMQLMLKEATLEDVHRDHVSDDVRLGPGDDLDHVSDDTCKTAAREAIPFIQEDLLMHYHIDRKVLGYV